MFRISAFVWDWRRQGHLFYCPVKPPRAEIFIDSKANEN